MLKKELMKLRRQGKKLRRKLIKKLLQPVKKLPVRETRKRTSSRMPMILQHPTNGELKRQRKRPKRTLMRGSKKLINMPLRRRKKSRRPLKRRRNLRISP